MSAAAYTAYTHLESLLLFQALRAEGVQTISFNRISDHLKNVPLIRNDPAYDPGRLSPDALRELYLNLLKDEVKHDLLQEQSQDRVSPGDSRKRKAPSPSLPNVHDAAQHAHLIPQLVTRLYTRYRDNVVRKLKDHEAKYTETARHIEEIDAGNWDERLRREDGLKEKQAASQTNSPKPSSTAHTLPVVARADHLPPVSADTSPASTPKLPNTAAQPTPKRYSQAKIDAVINHGPEPQDSPGSHRRVSSNSKLPSLSEMAPQSPRFGVPPNMPAQQIQPLAAHGSNHVYNHTPPAGHQSPYAPHHAHPRQGSMGSPQVQHSLSRPSSSPRPILPPPPGMSLPSPGSAPHTGSPIQHQYPSQQHYQPQPHRVQPGPTTGNYAGTPLAPHQQNYYQQPYQDRRAPYQQSHPQASAYGHQHPHPGQQQMAPHPGHVQQGMYMQPFQVASQDSNKPPPQQRLTSQQTPLNAQGQPPYAPHVYGAPATAPRLGSHQNRIVNDVIAALATPPRQKSIWKEKYRPSPIVIGSEVPSPAAEPLSPKQERRRSPTRSTRSTRGRDIPNIEEPLPAELSSKVRSTRRRTNVRDRSPHSVVSSTADESFRARSTRSHSVSTAVGAHPASDDRPGSRNGVKKEPSTPANLNDDTESMAARSVVSASGPATRKRRGTTQSQHLPPPKRKRHETPSVAGDEHEMSPPPTRSTVTATRNFAKMSSAVMNDILSHKHGSYFAGPVRDKDAPGYSEIVRQPQNLKAIRSAITAGTQAIKSASTTMDSPSDNPSATTGTVELERTADIIPPKAIVNGAQLEKELMRMFANAYMFNPGEDGMALSTQEMYEDVDRIISDWRGTERSNGAEREDEDDGKSKRRKG